jgi:acyl carrier protein
MFRLISRRFHTKIEEVEAYVLQTVKSFPKIEPDKVHKLSVLSDLGLDSLDTMELILDLEDKFCIRIDHKEVLQIQSVMDAITIFYRYKV